MTRATAAAKTADAAAKAVDAVRRLLRSEVGVRLALFPAVVVVTALTVVLGVVTGFSVLSFVAQGLALLSVPALLVGLVTLLALDPAEASGASTHPLTPPRVRGAASRPPRARVRPVRTDADVREDADTRG